MHPTGLFGQVFNPFFWTEWLLHKFLRIPFAILAAAGFDSEKAEHSLTGKLIKAIMGFVVFLAALLQALYYLGFLPSLQRAIKILPKK